MLVGHINMEIKMTIWFWVRIILLAYSALSAGDMVSPEAVAESNVTWIVAAIVAVIMLTFASIVSFVAIRVSKIGRGPKWTSNPFRSFLDFFHLGAWACLAGGIGSITFWLTSSPQAGSLAITFLAFGFCAVVGVKIGTSLGIKKQPNHH